MPEPPDDALMAPDGLHWWDGTSWWPLEAAPARPPVTFNRMANSVRLLLVLWGSLLFGSAAIYAVTEKVSYLDSVYWAIVTATTLGYGDLSPHTVAGRTLTAVLISLTVFLLIPLITANLASKLIVNRDAFTDEEQEEVKGALRELLRRIETGNPDAYRVGRMRDRRANSADAGSSS
jgi:voltage-gated potassium channel